MIDEWIDNAEVKPKKIKTIQYRYIGENMGDPDHDYHDKIEKERKIIAENNKKVLNELRKNDKEMDNFLAYKQCFKEKDEMIIEPHDKIQTANINEAIDGQDMKSYFSLRNFKLKYEEKYLEKANKLRMLVDDYCLFNQIKNELIQDGYKVEVNNERKKVKVYKEI